MSGNQFANGDVYTPTRMNFKTVANVTGAQMDTLTTKTTGMLAYCTTNGGTNYVAGHYYRYDGTNWQVLTKLRGTGAQIAAHNTFAGMTVYCTSTGSGFTINHEYRRNQADSAWLEIWVSPDNSAAHVIMGMVYGYTYVISDTTMVSSDAAAAATEAGYIPIKGISILRLNPSPSTIRIKFTLSAPYAGLHSFARIYVNGVPTGTLRDLTGAATTAYSEDISISEGDLIQIKAYEGSAGYPAFVSLFRLCGTDTAITDPVDCVVDGKLYQKSLDGVVVQTNQEWVS